MTRDDASPRSPTLGAWQNRLLPLMAGLLVGLALFFFLATLYLMLDLKMQISDPPTLAAGELEAILDSGQAPPISRALVLLEANALERRYHQANVLLMARLWTRYLGFLTGMILAFVGAAFILGKMQEQRADMAAEGAFGKVSLSTHSPGLLMVAMGTILMLTTILNHPKVSVNDAPVYLQAAGVAIAPPATKAQDLPETFPAVPEREAGDQDGTLDDLIRKARDKMDSPDPPKEGGRE